MLKCVLSSYYIILLVLPLQTVGKVLLTYAEVVKADFDHWVESQETACILMNNIQQCRVQLEKVYEAMGGDENLKEDTKAVMHDLQQMLNDAIDEMAEKYSVALRPLVLGKIREVNKLLHQVRWRRIRNDLMLKSVISNAGTKARNPLLCVFMIGEVLLFL